MNTSSILHLLALVASALGLDHNNVVESAGLANKVAKFKKDHALGEDVENALGAVLRAAETAPVSADSARAADVTKQHLDTIGEPGAVGPKGEEGPLGPVGGPGAAGTDGPTNESGAEGEEGESGDDTVESLKAANNHDALLALAKSEGVEVDQSATKADIAQAILDARAAK